MEYSRSEIHANSLLSEIPELVLQPPARGVGEVCRLRLAVSAGLTAGAYQDHAGAWGTDCIRHEVLSVEGRNLGTGPGSCGSTGCC